VALGARFHAEHRLPSLRDYEVRWDPALLPAPRVASSPAPWGGVRRARVRAVPLPPLQRSTLRATVTRPCASVGAEGPCAAPLLRCFPGSLEGWWWGGAGWIGWMWGRCVAGEGAQSPRRVSRWWRHVGTPSGPSCARGMLRIPGPCGARFLLLAAAQVHVRVGAFWLPQRFAMRWCDAALQSEAADGSNPSPGPKPTPSPGPHPTGPGPHPTPSPGPKPSPS
jgi:hypothetical protein